MDDTIASNIWTKPQEWNDELFHLKTMFENIGYNIPWSPEEFQQVICTENTTRNAILADVMKKIHPNEDFWFLSSNEDTSNEIMKRCIQVSKWFGMVENNQIVTGVSSQKEQIFFWDNLLSTAEQLVDDFNEIHEELDFTKLQIAHELVCSHDFNKLAQSHAVEEVKSSDSLSEFNNILQEKIVEVEDELHNEKDLNNEFQKLTKVSQRTEQELSSFNQVYGTQLLLKSTTSSHELLASPLKETSEVEQFHFNKLLKKMKEVQVSAKEIMKDMY